MTAVSEMRFPPLEPRLWEEDHTKRYDKIKSRDVVKYRGSLYYFQANGSSCYLYDSEETFGKKDRRRHGPSKSSVIPMKLRQIPVDTIDDSSSSSNTSESSIVEGSVAFSDARSSNDPEDLFMEDLIMLMKKHGIEDNQVTFLSKEAKPISRIKQEQRK